MKTKDMVTNEHAKIPISEETLAEHRKTLVYRHIAWLTSLRHAMRQTKKWEAFDRHRTNREWSKIIHIPERVFSLEDDLFHYLEPEEWESELVDKATEFFSAKGASADEFKTVFSNGRGKDLMTAAKKSGVQRVIDKGTSVITPT